METCIDLYQLSKSNIHQFSNHILCPTRPVKEYWRYAPFNVVSPTGLLNFSPASEILNSPFHFCSVSQRKVELLCEKQQLGQNTIFAQVVDFFCSLRLVALELDTLFYFVPDFHFVSDQKVSSSPSLSTNHDHSGP